MKLRDRSKKNDKKKRDDENEEDVDDPDVDDSDSDPEWAADAEERSEQMFPGMSKKRKSFNPIPLQMQSQPPKLVKMEPSSPATSSRDTTRVQITATTSRGSPAYTQVKGRYIWW